MSRKELPSRFAVIEGVPPSADAPRPEKRTKGPRGGKAVRQYKCGPCSDQLGYAYGHLAQHRLNAVESKGKLFGGSLWWCCARCGRGKFKIKAYADE